ncbi:hypothetical protein ACI75Y_00005, partial [Capnocytophaga stomatis]|uniref:hypothetical protein n=1 Tax=Capnocytophaga stomatis TaxID=1848904 RepID=UPI00385CAAC4
ICRKPFKAGAKVILFPKTPNFLQSFLQKSFENKFKKLKINHLNKKNFSNKEILKKKNLETIISYTIIYNIESCRLTNFLYLCKNSILCISII